MAKTKIPRSARGGLKRAFLDDGAKVADSTRDAVKDVKKTIRQEVQQGDRPRTKISWAVSVGDLVKIKASLARGPNHKEGMPVYGLVTYKMNRVNYNNQEDEFIIVMTPHSAGLKVHPKQVEVIYM